MFFFHSFFFILPYNKLSGKIPIAQHLTFLFDPFLLFIALIKKKNIRWNGKRKEKNYVYQLLYEAKKN